jgi:hypothetical protein
MLLSEPLLVSSGPSEDVGDGVLEGSLFVEFPNPAIENRGMHLKF